MSFIVGLCGKKGAGKDTLAKEIQSEVPEFVIMHFADRLKEICVAITDLDISFFTDAGKKEEILPEPIELDNLLPKLKEATGLDLVPRGITARTPRQILQHIGTDYVRYVDDMYWVNYLKSQIEAMGPRAMVVVADVRFNTEAAMIVRLGGVIVGVERPGLLSADAHKSETELTSIPTDISFRFEEGALHSHANASKAICALSTGTRSAENKTDKANLCVRSLVGNFNTALRDWEMMFDHGANFEWFYTKEGKKRLRVKDVAPVAALPADQAAVAVAEVQKIMETLDGQ